LIERAFARTFPSDLEPAHVARKLVATMEAQASHEGSTVVAPGNYTVRVSDDDFARLGAHREYLEEEWVALITEIARRVGIAFDSPPRVTLVHVSDIVPGAVEIDASSSEATAHKKYRLRIVKGLPPNATYPLERTTTMGRSTSNDVVLNDPRVSRQHARIEIANAAPLLADADSTNGTFLDGKRVAEPLPLGPGSVITLGNTTLVIEEDE